MLITFFNSLLIKSFNKLIRLNDMSQIAYFINLQMLKLFILLNVDYKI